MSVETKAVGSHLVRPFALFLVVAAWLALQRGTSIYQEPAPLRDPSLPVALRDRIRPQLTFEANAGQTDESVAYLGRGFGGTVFFRRDEIVLALPATSGEVATWQLQFLDANPAARPVGGERQLGTVNYLIGSDPGRWRTDIPTFATLRYQDLYPGIDLLYGGGAGRLKGTYVIAPGADPARIRWRHVGAAAAIDPVSGELHLSLASPNSPALVELPPVAWQDVGGRRRPVDVRYALGAAGEISFELGPYDAAEPLIIDPILTYGTYLGGSSGEEAHAIAIDSQGSFYVTGATGSVDFPLANPVQPNPSAFGDLFVTKFTPEGSGLVYSTYLGGNNSEVGFGIAVDDDGHAYVTGESWSSDFPTVNPIQIDPGIQFDVIVLKLSPAGNSLIYSTYLGGFNSQTGWSIAVDAAGSAYVAGDTISPNFPVMNAFQPQMKGMRDAFVAKINAEGSALVYSTFLGSSGSLDYGFAIAVDADGHAHVTGQTTDEDFPTHNALQPSNGGFGDGFVTKFSPDGASLVYSTYLGGGLNDRGRSIAVDASGNTYVTGPTGSADFPTANAYQPDLGGADDVFVSKINAAGTAFVYSTFLGGSNLEGNYDSNVAVDAAGNAYVAGNTHSADFPTVNPIQPALKGYIDGFVSKFSADGTTLIYSTYLGGTDPFAGPADVLYGLAADDGGNAYVTGYTFSPDFPLAGASFQTANAGFNDAFIAVINDGETPPPTPTAIASPTPTNSPTATVTPQATATATVTPTAVPPTGPDYAIWLPVAARVD